MSDDQLHPPTMEELDAHFQRQASAPSLPLTLHGPLPPEGGWHPEDFPQVTTDLIPYTTHTFPSRPDPMIAITAQGWLYLDIGNVRVALPNRTEWDKLTYITEATWNAHEQALAQQGEDNGSGGSDEAGLGGQAPVADLDQLGSRGESGAPVSPES